MERRSAMYVTLSSWNYKSNKNKSEEEELNKQSSAFNGHLATIQKYGGPTKKYLLT